MEKQKINKIVITSVALLGVSYLLTRHAVHKMEMPEKKQKKTNKSEVNDRKYILVKKKTLSQPKQRVINSNLVQEIEIKDNIDENLENGKVTYHPIALTSLNKNKSKILSINSSTEKSI